MESRAPKLLIVDDDPKLARLLTGFLASEGYQVSVAHDGAEGLQMLRRETWDLVILDVMLPRIDGFEVLAQLRRRSSLPVLMLTGRGGETDLLRGLDSGADDYLPKTASSRELASRVRALLRRAGAQGAKTAPEAEGIVCVRGLTLDAGSRSAEVDGRAVNLTPVEFALLWALVRHRGRTRSREQLMQEVRDRRFEMFDRAIDVHVASLRRKLGDDSRTSRFIRTVRSAGYLFVDEDAIS